MRMVSACAVCVLMLCASAAFGAQIEIAKDRMLVVNGERTFVLGLYDNPQDDALLRQVVDAGFNLISCGASREALDRLQSAGAFAWVNLGSNIDLSESAEERRQSLLGFVNEFGAHPALLALEVPDEALWGCWYGPVHWRLYEEPELQRKAIDALQDEQVAQALREKQPRARELFDGGRFRDAEQLADSIWADLGTTSPKPGYNVSGAREAAEKTRGGLLAGYQYLKSLGLRQPIWMNHAPRNQIPQLAAFSEAADIVGCDIYPVPEYQVGHSDLADRSISSVGAYTLRMQEAAPGKPVWMVLQGFAWRDLEPSMEAARAEIMGPPEFEETRFMAYDAIVRGARGILYWGSSAISKDSELWRDLLALARELKAMRHVIAAPDANLRLTVTYEQTWGSVDRSVVVLPKAVGGRTWLLAVNEWTEPLTYTIHGLERMEGATYVDTASQQQAAVRDGALTLTIAGNGVHVLEPRGAGE